MSKEEEVHTINTTAIFREGTGKSEVKSSTSEVLSLEDVEVKFHREEIEDVQWEELMPECLWKFRVKDFGPLTVGIDAHGNSLYHDVQAAAHEKLKELYARL